MKLHGLKTTFAGVFALIITLGAGIAATAQPSSSADPRDQLNAWAGRWNDTGELKETPYTHAAHFQKHVTCGWTGDRGFMTCEYLDVNAPQTDIEHNLSIWAYDEKAQAFRHFGIGSYEMSEEPEVTVQGNAWSYISHETGKSGAKYDMRATYEFVTPEKRVTHLEISHDGGKTWVLIVEEVETKES